MEWQKMIKKLESLKYSFVIKKCSSIICLITISMGLMLLFFYDELLPCILPYKILYLALLLFLLFSSYEIVKFFRFECGKYGHYTYIEKNTINPHINIGVFFHQETGVLLNFVRSLSKVTGRDGGEIDILIYSALCDEKMMIRKGFEPHKSKWSVRYLRKGFYCFYCWAAYFWTVIHNPNCETAQSAKKTRKERMSLSSNFDTTWKRTGTSNPPIEGPNSADLKLFDLHKKISDN